MISRAICPLINHALFNRGLACFFAITILSSPTLFAAQRVGFQGRLSNSAGAPVPDGSYDMVFRFYDAAVAGTLLLTDSHVQDRAVQTTGGLYSIFLGDGQLTPGLDSDLWSVFLNHPEVFIGVSIRGEPEMSPRLPLTTTPYAVRAQDAITLSGKPASQFLDASASAQTKSGQLILSGGITDLPILNVTNTASGAGIQTVAAGTNAALVALNTGSGPLIRGGGVFEVANSGKVTSAAGYSLATPKTGRMTLGPADFVPRHPSEEQYILWGYPWKTNRHYLICTMESGSASFHADVHLPEGARITKLIGYIYDVDPGRTSILNLARCSLLGHTGPDPVYLATLDSAPNQIRLEKTLSETVNTASSHYVLSLRLYWSDLGMQFFGAQVEYTYTDLKN